MPDFLQRFGQRHDNGEYYFSNVRSGLIVGMLSIGTLIGALIAAPIADKIGRRYSLSLASCILAVGLIVQISADDHWYQVMMGRWVAGLGVGACSLLTPMYQAETGPKHIRGALISTYQLFITIGIFLAACINYGTYEHQRTNSGSWRISIGLGFFFCAVLGFGILLMPETPRFVYRRGDKELARQTMMKVYGAPANHYTIELEMEEIEAKLRAESASKGPIAEWITMLRMYYRHQNHGFCHELLTTIDRYSYDALQDPAWYDLADVPAAYRCKLRML
jgi:SP family sugar:H+ symporter-like MFS transporter